MNEDSMAKPNAAPTLVEKKAKGVATKAPRQDDYEPEEAEATPTASNKKSKGPTAKGLPCLCGCGQPTLTENAKFIPGHDAKLKSLLLRVERGEAKKSEIPEVAKAFLQKSKMSGAWSFPTESGNTPDEDKHGKPYSERKEEVEAEKARKAEEKKAKLAALKQKNAKSAKAKSKVTAPADDEDEDEELEETEE
jgi:hypothetical protein